LRRYRHLKFFQHGGGRHLAFVRTVNSAVRSAVPVNPILEPNMKWIGSPVAEIWPFAYVGSVALLVARRINDRKVAGSRPSVYHSVDR